MRKKLFAILMSAMMMVTFMPTMAFAAETVAVAKVAADHKTVTVTYGTESATFKTTRTFDGDSGTGSGVITVKADPDSVKSVLASDLTISDTAREKIAGKVGYGVEKWTYEECTKTETQHKDAWGNVDKYNGNEEWSGIKTSYTKVEDKKTGTFTQTNMWGGSKTFNFYQVGDIKDATQIPEDRTGMVALEYYYDLTGATLVNATSKTLAATLKAGQYSANKVNAIKVVEPADLVLSGHTADTAVISELTGWTVKFSNGLTETEDAALSTAAYTDREVNWTVSATPVADVVNNITPEIGDDIVYYEGTFPTAKQTIKAETPTLASVKLYKDEVKTGNDMTFGPNSYGFDAAEHTVVTQGFDGIQVTFQKLGADGKYADVEGNKLTFKDVDAGNYQAVIGWTDAAKAKADPAIKRVFSVAVTPQTVNFVVGNAYVTDRDVYEGETVDPYKYIVASITGDTENKLAKADAATLAALAKELFTAEAKADAHDASKITVTVNTKKFTEAEWTALTKKYVNYNFGARTTSVAEKGTVNLTVKESKANKVEIYNMAKTYKVKALKKAKKAFAINAEADSNTAITFKKVAGSSKLSVKDAKVVVKKGTKKGTYQIKVKATAAAGNGYAKATTVQVIKVRVK